MYTLIAGTLVTLAFVIDQLQKKQSKKEKNEKDTNHN